MYARWIETKAQQWSRRWLHMGGTKEFNTDACPSGLRTCYCVLSSRFSWLQQNDVEK
jgi:hypothetical protein